MTVFYKFLILDIIILILSAWLIYNAIKRPLKKKEPYNLNLMQYIRAFGMLIVGIILLIALVIKKW